MYWLIVGNKYYEHPPTTDYKHRPKRSVKYLKKVEWDEVGKNMPGGKIYLFIINTLLTRFDKYSSMASLVETY